MINQWINNSDNKTAIVLGLIGIFLTIIFTNGYFVNNIFKIITKMISNINFSDILYLLFLISLIYICLYGLWSLIKVLVPTLKMNTKTTKSYLYFGSISNYSSFKEYKNDLIEASSDDIIDDLLNQVYQNSIICNKKYINFAKGIKCFLIGFVGTLIMYVIGVLIYL